MSFSFSGRHMEVGESLATRAQTACESLAQKYGIEFIDVNIVMKKDGYLFHSDITVKTNTGNSYFAGDKADDPNVSFDVTLQKIDLQIQKKKKSFKGCKERIAEIAERDNSFQSAMAAGEEAGPMIIAQILDDIPLLSVSDAAKRLNDKLHVFVFENISNNAVNVVYTREDGNIGWIDYKQKR